MFACPTQEKKNLENCWNETLKPVTFFNSLLIFVHVSMLSIMTYSRHNMKQLWHDMFALNVIYYNRAKLHVSFIKVAIMCVILRLDRDWMESLHQLLLLSLLFSRCSVVNFQHFLFKFCNVIWFNWKSPLGKPILWVVSLGTLTLRFLNSFDFKITQDSF